MNIKTKIMLMENRIALLTARGETMNAKIIAKLRRQLRKIKESF